jgi:hypothetical protein
MKKENNLSLQNSFTTIAFDKDNTESPANRVDKKDLQ